MQNTSLARRNGVIYRGKFKNRGTAHEPHLTGGPARFNFKQVYKRNRRCDERAKCVCLGITEHMEEPAAKRRRRAHPLLDAVMDLCILSINDFVTLHRWLSCSKACLANLLPEEDHRLYLALMNCIRWGSRPYDKYYEVPITTPGYNLFCGGCSIWIDSTDLGRPATYPVSLGTQWSEGRMYLKCYYTGKCRYAQDCGCKHLYGPGWQAEVNSSSTFFQFDLKVWKWLRLVVEEKQGRKLLQAMRWAAVHPWCSKGPFENESTDASLATTLKALSGGRKISEMKNPHKHLAPPTLKEAGNDTFYVKICSESDGPYFVKWDPATKGQVFLEHHID